MNIKTRTALEIMKQRFEQIIGELEGLNVGANLQKYKELNKERATLELPLAKYQLHQDLETEIKALKSALVKEKNRELIALIRVELDSNQVQAETLATEIEALLIPKDPNDEKNVIMEIRGAAGGDEANIFAGDLFRMYRLYSEKVGWKFKVLEASPSEAGGFTQIVMMIKGPQVYSKLKFESGSHRVQRVPKTETRGRIQTSTATVAVMPEVNEVEISIKPTDLRIDTYRASGAGGQHVNTTDSAVRITHLPTGIVTTSQEGRSQHDNKDLAMQMLRSKVYEAEKAKQEAATSAVRRQAVGTGARSEKIRTYNYPQNRVTDHRISLTLNKLDQIMEGNLEDIIIALITDHNGKEINKNIT